MINSIAERHPFEYVVQWLTDRIELDPGFKTFFEWQVFPILPTLLLCVSGRCGLAGRD